MHSRGTCSVQCFRAAYRNLSLTPRTPCLLQPLSSPTTRHSDVLTAVSRLTMHLQYVSSYHTVRGAHCVSDTHALGTSALRLRGTVSEREYCYVPSHHIGSFIFALPIYCGVLVSHSSAYDVLCLVWNLTFRSHIQNSGQLNCLFSTVIISVIHKLQIYR